MNFFTSKNGGPLCEFLNFFSSKNPYFPLSHLAFSWWEVETLINPKLKANSQNDTITAESPGRLGEVFIEIARKHNLDEKEAHQMLYELLSALK
jgi:hypothetical protein